MSTAQHQAKSHTTGSQASHTMPGAFDGRKAFNLRATPRAGNLLLSFCGADDHEAVDRGFTFLGVAAGETGNEVHVFQMQPLDAACNEKCDHLAAPRDAQATADALERMIQQQNSRVPPFDADAMKAAVALLRAMARPA